MSTSTGHGSILVGAVLLLISVALRLANWFVRICLHAQIIVQLGGVLCISGHDDGYGIICALRLDSFNLKRVT